VRWTIASRSTPKAGLDLVGDGAEDRCRHRFERLVFERFDGPTGMARGFRLLARRRRPGRRARPAEEPDDRAILGTDSAPARSARIEASNG
jgi:hypothetical protein